MSQSGLDIVVGWTGLPHAAPSVFNDLRGATPGALWAHSGRTLRTRAGEATRRTGRTRRFTFVMLDRSVRRVCRVAFLAGAVGAGMEPAAKSMMRRRGGVWCEATTYE